MIGRILAHYETLDKLGSGGMGDVYRARDTKLERDVAIKAVAEELSRDKERTLSRSGTPAEGDLEMVVE